MKDDFGAIIQQVKQLDTRAVVQWFDLHPIRGSKKKYPCPICGSKDNLNIDIKYGAGARCYTPGCHPDKGRVWSNVDLVMQTQQLDFKEAVEWLAVRAGIKQGKGAITKTTTLYVEREVERVDKREVVGAWHDVYEQLTLGERGRQYIKSRNIPVALAEAVGLVSIEDVGQWHATIRNLGGEMARKAGLMSERGAITPWHQKPALVIPYLAPDKSLDLLRFRCLDPSEKRFRYLSPSGFHADYPYVERAISVAASEGQMLYITEGELDALSMIAEGHMAISSCGAGSWRDEWAQGFDGLMQGVTIVADGDGADGLKFAKRVMGSCVAVHGATWTRAYVKVIACPPQAKDANALLQQNALQHMIDGGVVSRPFDQTDKQHG